MPKPPVRPFRRTDNVAILNAIRNERSSDYINRIPAANKANMREVFDTIWNYTPARNEFATGLINQIGRVVGRNILWENRLAKFKIGMLEHGDTIEEYAYGLIVSETYDPSRDYLEKTLFGQEAPNVKAAFHKRNQRRMYKITINEQELRAAFTSDQTDSLYQLTVDLMNSQLTSDQVDEFILMTRLLREYYDAGGFWKVNVPDLLSGAADKDDAESFLVAVREWAETLQFVSTHYNPAHMPTVATADKLELIMTPRAKALIDVKALAAAFNVSYADIESRTTIIRPEDMNIPGAQAILTTTDFFMVADTYLESASQPNAAGRYVNHFWHHDQIVSVSPFAPAILFTSTEQSDEVVVDDPDVVGISAITAHDKDGVPTNTAVRGEYTQILGSAITDPAGGLNDEVVLALTGATSEHTYISNTGTLYVGLDELADQITVNAYTTNPAPVFVGSLVLPIVGDRVNHDGLDETVDDDTDDLDEVTPTAPTLDAGDVTIPTVTGVTYRVDGEPVTGDITVVGSLTVTATPDAGYVFPVGATTSWTFDE